MTATETRTEDTENYLGINPKRDLGYREKEKYGALQNPPCPPCDSSGSVSRQVARKFKVRSNLTYLIPQKNAGSGVRRYADTLPSNADTIPLEVPGEQK